MLGLNQVLDLIEKQGKAWYLGEEITQLAHALQTARLAEQDRVAPALVAASLLHDLGHMMAKTRPDFDENAPVDDRHEHIGSGILNKLFGHAVSEPVRLHVEAKRYLCATDEAYGGALTEASRRSLALQGGAFLPEEARAFRRRAYAEDAIRLRRWDDRAKDPAVKTKDLKDYAPLLRQLAR